MTMTMTMTMKVQVFQRNNLKGILFPKWKYANYIPAPIKNDSVAD